LELGLRDIENTLSTSLRNLIASYDEQRKTSTHFDSRRRGRSRPLRNPDSQIPHEATQICGQTSQDSRAVEIFRLDLRYEYRRPFGTDAWEIENGINHYLKCANLKSIEDCENAYTELSAEVFGKEQPGNFRYNVKDLEDNIETVLHKAEETRETGLFDDRPDCCRTFVVAKRRLALDASAVLLRSYEIDGSEVQCTILEAARATSAAPTFFPEAKIGRDYYIDGGIGSNNPAGEALHEAYRIWGVRRIGCLVSIGTGLMEPISAATRSEEQFGGPFGRIFTGIAPLTAEKLSVAQYCTELATSCQMVHRDLVQNKAELKQNKGAQRRYYRFNVVSGMAGVGLHEVEKMAKISQVTDAYLGEPETREFISDCIELLYSDEAIKVAAG